MDNVWNMQYFCTGEAAVVTALHYLLLQGSGAIELDAMLGLAARRPIQRMLDFAAAQRQPVRASGELERDAALFQNFGPA